MNLLLVESSFRGENLWQSWLQNPADLTPKQQTVLKRANEIIASAKKADILVFGAPLYNFTVTSTLKAWLDHLTRSGETFIYTENGVQGLLNNKKVVVLGAIGGNYENEGDFQTPYLRYVFGFNGLTDVTFINAKALNFEQMRQQSLENACKQIKQFVDNI